MKELTTSYKILLFLSGIIVVNIILFVFKSSATGSDTLLGGAASLQKYILKNYNSFYIFNNGTSHSESATRSYLTLVTADNTNSKGEKTNLQVIIFFYKS